MRSVPLPVSCRFAPSLTLVSGQPVLMAVVAPAAPATGSPTGSVQFIDIATHATVGSATLTGGKASLTVAANGPTQILARPIAAVYSGDGNFAGGTSRRLW